LIDEDEKRKELMVTIEKCNYSFKLMNCEDFADDGKNMPFL